MKGRFGIKGMEVYLIPSDGSRAPSPCQLQRPLLVERGARQPTQLGLVQGKGRDHDGGMRLLLAVQDRVPHLLQARLQPLELGDFVFQREVGGQRRLGDQWTPAPSTGIPRARPCTMSSWSWRVTPSTSARRRTCR